jgi:hypothetical protein
VRQGKRGEESSSHVVGALAIRQEEDRRREGRQYVR